MKWPARAIVLTSVAGLALWIFADALRDGPFLFRDAAHFYDPLFRYTADEWAAGRTPLWNPYENLGMPLAANPAASVFYPGKLVFALPIGFVAAYKLYVLAHLLLAAAAAYRLARHWNASVWAAGLCALSYAFSGNVLFDYSNVVFLVGAAWLPLAMLAADRALRGTGTREPENGEQASSASHAGRLRWAVALGVVLAMMVLGGDPQMAYNAGLLAAMLALWLWWNESPVSAWKRAMACLCSLSPCRALFRLCPLSLWERVRVRVDALDIGTKEENACRTPSSVCCNAMPENGPENPHPSPLPKGERTVSLPHPSPLPKGEGTCACIRPLAYVRSLACIRPLACVRSLAYVRSLACVRSRLSLLAIAAAVGLALSAVQVLPAMEFTRLSGRTTGPLADRLLGQIEPGTHSEHTYLFSVGPWRLAEYVWPNVGGRAFPENRRWLNVIPAEADGNTWTPSLYMGLLPLLLALGTLRFRRSRSPFKKGATAGLSSSACKSCEQNTAGQASSGTQGSTDQLSQRAVEQPEVLHDDSAALDRWLSWVAVLAVAAGFGWFGLGWLIDEIYCAAGGDVAGLGFVGEPTGGVYWLMTVVLPGYARFRYPAKLLVVAALGLSVLAARGFDRLLADPTFRLHRVLFVLGGTSLCGAAMAWAVLPVWGDWLQAIRPDPLFGPIDAAGAAGDLIRAFLHTGVLCGLVWTILRYRDRKKFGVLVPGMLVLLTAVDLGVANRWMVVCGPADTDTPLRKSDSWLSGATAGLPSSASPGNSQYTAGQASSGTLFQRPAAGNISTSKLADAIRRDADQDDAGPYRVLRRPVWIRPVLPPRELPGPAVEGIERMAQTVQWNRDTLWPHYNLTERIALAQVLGTMAPRDYEAFFTAGERLAEQIEQANPRGEPRVAYAPFQLARYLIVPGRTELPGAEPIETDASGVSLWHNPRALPRAWIVHEVDVLPPLKTDDNESLWQRTAEVLCPAGRPRDLRRSATVETTLPMPWDDAGSTSSRPVEHETCRVARLEPARVEIEARLARPGLVVLADQFYPGWQLRVETQGQPARAAAILRTNRVMRGVWLPEGAHKIIYRYRPKSLARGAALSGSAWLGLLLAMVWGAARRLRCFSG